MKAGHSYNVYGSMRAVGQGNAPGWWTGDYSPCSKLCGGGIRERKACPYECARAMFIVMYTGMYMGMPACTDRCVRCRRCSVRALLLPLPTALYVPSPTPSAAPCPHPPPLNTRARTPTPPPVLASHTILLTHVHASTHMSAHSCTCLSTHPLACLRSGWKIWHQARPAIAV